MSVNSSSNSSSYPLSKTCFYSKTNSVTLTALLTCYILVLVPLFSYVLYLGYQRCRKQRSSSQAVMNSHSDIITFNMVTLELVGIFGFCLYCYGTYSNLPIMVKVGLYISAIISPGQTLFHLLTCVDRYLAVVHPVTYLGLKQSGGIRIRNVIIGCIWLLCIVALTQTVSMNVYISSNVLLLSISFAIVSFCCVSVLFVLIRPGPGEMGGNRNRVDQSKKRAFHTIMVIMGVLFARFCAILIFNAVLASPMIKFIDYCLVMLSASWFTLPSSLVLPVLFLHRTGKLPWSK